MGKVDTRTLTASADSFTGTGGNDTFVAAQQNTNDTLAAGDTIDGGAGTDRLNVFGDGNIGSFAAANISNVEQVYAQFSGTAGADTLNVSANAGVQQAWVSKGQLNGADVVTLTKAQTAGIEGTVLATNNNADTLTFNFSNASAAAGDVASLALNGANVATTGSALASVTINAIETLNLSATGANRLGTLANNNTMTTINVAGAGSVNATVGSNAITTVNAADNTGGVTLNTTASAGNNQTITGGTGDDTITTTYAGLSNQDTINLGDGTDSLIFTDAATFNTTTTAARLTNVSNVEKLGTVGTLLTVDGDLVSQNIFTTSGANGDFAITNAANNATLEFGAGAANASTAAMKLAANTLNVELNGSTAAAANVGNGLTVTGSQTVNLSTNGTAGVTANTLALTAADNQTVVITGSQDLTLTTTAATGTTGFTLNGADATGKLNITGTNAADTIIGGAGDDTLNGGGAVGANEVQTFTVTGAATTTANMTVGGVNVALTNGDSVDTIGGKIAAEQAAIKAANTNVDTVTYDAATDTVSVTYLGTTDVANIAVSAATTGATFGAVTEATKGGTGAVAFTADTYTGGAGKDTFIVGTNGAAAASDADVITDFVSKTDKIDFAAFNVAGSAANYSEASAAVADFAAAKTAADAAFAANTTTVYSVQQVGSDSYVFAADANNAAAEHVVKLTGVALDGIEFADIVA